MPGNRNDVRESRDQQKEQYNLNKLQKRLRRCVGEAIADFNMIEEGDRVMVCLSGGKDSYTMLEILRNLQQSAPVDFTLVAVNLDQKQPGFPETVLPAYLENQASNTASSKRIPTVSSRRKFRREKPPALSVLACAAAFSIAPPTSCTAIRSRWVTTVTTCWKPCFSTCSTAASSKGCPQADER